MPLPIIHAFDKRYYCKLANGDYYTYNNLNNETIFKCFMSNGYFSNFDNNILFSSLPTNNKQIIAQSHDLIINKIK